MSLQSKVVWNEGTFLMPQHFQQADGYHEELLNFRIKSLAPFWWGVMEIKIDEDALESGNFCLEHCSGIFPDGLPFNIPDPDEAPESRSVAEFFPASLKLLEVYLAVPSRRPGGQDCRLDHSPNGRQPRFLGQSLTRPDENAGGKSRDILTAKKNLKILLAGKTSQGEVLGQSLDGYSFIKVAEIIRRDSARPDNVPSLSSESQALAFSLRKEYIAPCLHLSSSNHLKDIVKNLHKRMLEKSRILSERRYHKITGLVEFSTFDVTTFWLLHTVNSYVPLLSHFIDVEETHPEQLYRLLAQLAGELTTFDVKEHPGDLPHYWHTALSRTFDQLDAAIRRLLETVIPTNCDAVPLSKTPESWWVGRIENDDWFETRDFYLAVSAEMPDRRLRQEVQEKIKIGILDDIESLVNHALPSRIEISFIERPPASIPVKAGFQYFHLPSRDAYWTRVRGMKNLAIYLPKVFKGLQVELMAVKTGTAETHSLETIE